MTLAAYIVLSVLVAIMGGGLPGLGDAALIAAGARAGEGHLIFVRLAGWTVLPAHSEVSKDAELLVLRREGAVLWWQNPRPKLDRADRGDARHAAGRRCGGA